MATYGIQNMPAPPSPAAGQQAGPGPQGDAMSLLGPQMMAQQQQQQRANLQQSLQAMTKQFTDLNQIIDALASQHPEAATKLNVMKDAGREALMLISQKLTRGQEAGQMPPIAA